MHILAMMIRFSVEIRSSVFSNKVCSCKSEKNSQFLLHKEIKSPKEQWQKTLWPEYKLLVEMHAYLWGQQHDTHLLMTLLKTQTESTEKGLCCSYWVPRRSWRADGFISQTKEMKIKLEIKINNNQKHLKNKSSCYQLLSKTPMMGIVLNGRSDFLFKVSHSIRWQKYLKLQIWTQWESMLFLLAT